ncbi:Membrane-associated enzyme, PAP2 (acid phosphatase) superfamily [Faunimonas pinastri]|uniref:Membrane-associated enzyme, PAP2 (Acid phosphatase) superfamily n=1 Tax=Faunimonas pinastri TaxID=1855383 RepID=A0A1H9MEX8_9HYPH|nr:GNAT family N-acetyltransferase [Faunimonas pinastri]SER22266.1 Membrane-associated enzyme, PAP2 (acid phosphatase) superfamily [Faunimonas pinastri]
MFEIRLAREADYPALAALLIEEQRFYHLPQPARQHLLRDLAALPDGVEALVCFDGADLVGAACFSAVYPGPGLTRGLFLKDLFVAERARGKGAGRLLMQQMATLAAERGCTFIDWTTQKDNEPARALHASLGARVRSENIAYRLQDQALLDAARGQGRETIPGSRSEAPEPVRGFRRRMASRVVRQGARLHSIGATRPLVATLFVTTLLSILFMAWPALDIAVAHAFYIHQYGFNGPAVELLQLIRHIGQYIEIAVLVGLLLPLLLKLLLPRTRMLVLKAREIFFAVGVFLIGPGLIVNGIFKDYWGRARPRDILQFGGQQHFSPAWFFSNQCDDNCSFVSGEGSTAFWIVVLVFLVPPRWRKATVLATTGFAATVSFTRIAMGGHFLSDVLLSWCFTLVVILMMKQFVLDGLPTSFDRAVENGIGRAGLALRRALGEVRRLVVKLSGFALRRHFPSL